MIATKHETRVGGWGYPGLHFHICEVEGGVSGMSLCPGEEKPFWDLNVPKFFLF